MLFCHMALQLFVEPEEAADILKVKYCQGEQCQSTLRLKRLRCNSKENFQMRTGLVKGSNYWSSVGLLSEFRNSVQRCDQKNRRCFHTRTFADCFPK